MYLQIEKGDVICCNYFYHTAWISGLKSLGIESEGRKRECVNGHVETITVQGWTKKDVLQDWN